MSGTVSALQRASLADRMLSRRVIRMRPATAVEKAIARLDPSAPAVAVLLRLCRKTLKLVVPERALAADVASDNLAELAHTMMAIRPGCALRLRVWVRAARYRARPCRCAGQSEALDRVMLTSPDKTPWTSDGLRACFLKACTKAVIRDLHFNDLRGTAVTRLAIAGATEFELAAIMSHTVKDVHSILDRHYLSGDLALAGNAMRKLEENQSMPKSAK